MHGTISPRERLYQRMREGARNYASFDRSDPFALQRALSHIASGVCEPHAESGKDCHYDAEVFMEDGRVVYRNVARP